jgi:hypothetical protein
LVLLGVGVVAVLLAWGSELGTGSPVISELVQALSAVFAAPADMVVAHRGDQVIEADRAAIASSPESTPASPVDATSVVDRTDVETPAAVAVAGVRFDAHDPDTNADEAANIGSSVASTVAPETSQGSASFGVVGLSPVRVQRPLRIHWQPSDGPLVRNVAASIPGDVLLVALPESLRATDPLSLKGAFAPSSMPTWLLGASYRTEVLSIEPRDADVSWTDALELLPASVQLEPIAEVNVRSGPTMNSLRVGSVHESQACLLRSLANTDDIRFGWVPVACPGRVAGFVAAELLDPVRREATR